MEEIKINLISGSFKPGSQIFGVSRYHLEIHKRLESKIIMNWIFYDPIKKLPNFFDFYLNYPIIINKKIWKNVPVHILNPWFSHIPVFPRSPIKNSRLIVTIFDVEPSVIFNTLKSLFHWKLCRKGILKADRIITISQFAKNEILKFLGYKFPEEKISIVYEGVDREVFKKLDDDEELDKLKRKIVPNSKNNTKIILFVGSEQPRKNFLGVLKACYKVMKETNYDLKIIKIGKAESEVYRKESVKLAEELRIVSNVLFIDYVPDDELVKYYNIADCLVLPTIYEGGFALPILEAMSCECPVVTSNIQPLLELTEGKGAIYINPFNVDEIANAILKILNGQIDIEELTREGSRIAKKYTWERSAEEFYKTYKELQ